MKIEIHGDPFGEKHLRVCLVETMENQGDEKYMKDKNKNKKKWREKKFFFFFFPSSIS